MRECPSYLQNYEELYEERPRRASRQWFDDAEYGLFLHYGLYSLLAEHEWVQYHRKIPPSEYAELKAHFTTENFDAEEIVSFARECGMEYINLTSRHHDGFCLFDSAYTTYKSTEAPCGRDLVGELAEACQDAGIGLFLYYSHAYDWHHPHAPNRSEWGDPVRPNYDEIPGLYADEGHDLNRYLEYVESQITELLTDYGPIAGIWLDPSFLPQQDTERFADAFDLPALYEHVRELQPQVLVSYKEGVTGTEDFLTPEHETLDAELGKPGEVCTTMIPGEGHEDEIGDLWGYGEENAGETQDIATSWGYAEAAEGMHKSAEEVWEEIARVRRHGYNLLLNTGLCPDGGIDPEDERILRKVGERIRREGMPGTQS